MAECILEISGVTKSFTIPSARPQTVRRQVLRLFRPQRTETLDVLKNVTFAVEEGQTVGVMGRNGCGKSTLLKIIAGIYAPNAGRLVVRAPVTPILELGVGWNPALDAVDNIYLLGSVMGMTLRELRASIEEILTFADLERFANLELRHYSSGMAARLAYSVAFKAVRDILILDEIFAVGDAGFRMRCEQRYRDLKAAGHTTLLVSHAVPIVTEFCDRAILIDQGRIVRDGSPGDVAKAYLQVVSGEGRDALHPPLA